MCYAGIDTPNKPRVTLFLAKSFMVKILFVCLGNICRSPLAESIFNHKIKENGLENYFLAESCGTADYHIGDSPDPRTINSAQRNGIEIQHICRQLSTDDLRRFDLIVPMDHSNRSSIFRVENAAEFRDKIILIREFDNDGKGKDVPDPYYGKEKEFQEVFEILNRSVDGLLKYLLEKMK